MRGNKTYSNENVYNCIYDPSKVERLLIRGFECFTNPIPIFDDVVCNVNILTQCTVCAISIDNKTYASLKPCSFSSKR